MPDFDRRIVLTGKQRIVVSSGTSLLSRFLSLLKAFQKHLSPSQQIEPGKIREYPRKVKSPNLIQIVHVDQKLQLCIFNHHK